VVSVFVHNGQASDVESVMVDGRFLLRDGRALTLDETDVVARAEEIARRVWGRLVERYPDVPFPIRWGRRRGDAVPPDCPLRGARKFSMVAPTTIPGHGRRVLA
jgi:hypothetical protein